MLPVEAHATRLILYAVGLDEGRQGGRDTREDGLISILLMLLQLFPPLDDCASRLCHRFAIDVGMTIDELVAKSIGHITEVEAALLLTNGAVEDNVQEDIA